MSEKNIEGAPQNKTLGEQIFEHLTTLTEPISSADLMTALGKNMQLIRQAAVVYNTKASQHNYPKHIVMDKQGRVMFYSVGNRDTQVPYHLQDDIKNAVEKALSRKPRTQQNPHTTPRSWDAYALAYLSLLLNPELDLSSLTRYSLNDENLLVFTLESKTNLREELASRQNYEPELFMDSFKALLNSNKAGLSNLYLILIHTHTFIEALTHKEKWSKAKAKTRINASSLSDSNKKIYLYLINKTDADGNLLWTDRELQAHADALNITKEELKIFLETMNLEWEILDICVLKRKSFHKREYEFQFILTKMNKL